MYGHPFLLENLPLADSAPLADYLPYLILLRELLRKHADQILPHSLKISVKPGHLVLQKGSSTLSIGTSVDQPSSGHSHDTCCCQAQWDPPVVAPLKEQLEKQRRELEDSWNPLGNNMSQWLSWPMPFLMPMFLALLFLTFLPCIITSCTSRDINRSKTIQRTAMRAPHQDSGV
jgi:hypothetical protein